MSRPDPDTLAHLRHELRTPLNHIIGYSEMLAEDVGGRRPELVPELRRLWALGHEVLRLVNDTLAPARVDAGVIDFAGLERSAGSVVDEIIALAAQGKKHAEAVGESRLVEDVDRIATSAEDLRALLRGGLTIGVTPPRRAQTTPTVAATAELHPRDVGTILVVDDNAENRDMLARRLVGEGHHVKTAADGEDALRALSREPFDLVLLDVMMPGMDGIEVLRRLKADDWLRDVPVLMVSSLGELERVVRSIELGAEDYLPKPFDPVLLRARIGACLEKKRLRDRERRHLDELAEWNRTLEQRVADKVGEIERLGQLTRFVAPQLAEAILAGDAEDPLKPHRREIVVVFLDVRGFHIFMETAEPEEVMGVLAEYHAGMGKIILAHEGTVEKFAGDAIIVIFNDPIEISDPAVRAVRMAVAMRDRFGDLAARWKKRGWDMNLGIGIAQGFATIGAVGFEGRWDYAAMGRVVNIAGHLCNEAKEGQIFVTTKVAAAVEDIAETKALDALQLSGIARPQPAFSVLGLKRP